jgi:hypothetical protein
VQREPGGVVIIKARMLVSGRRRIVSFSSGNRVARLALIVGALAVLATGCGQTDGAHTHMVGVAAPQVVTVDGPGATTTTPTEDTDVGDVGGVIGVGITGDSTTLPGESTGSRIVTHVTVTKIPQFHYEPKLTNTAGPLYVCPVQGNFSVGDSFGAPRYAGGYHPHGGNDIFADPGTPIVSPFDGVAENASNTLGGNAVIVRGDDGYVYNAHLSAYGTLGNVKAGDIIGYVGNTGDAIATPPHDHF